CSTFLGTQHLDPNKFYANCYSPQEPGPFQPYSDLVTHQAPSANSFSVDRSQSQQLQRQWDAQSHDDDRREALLGRSQSTSGWSPYNISASGSHTSPGTQHLALADPTSFGADSHTSSSSREPGPSKSHSDSVTHQAPSGTPADRVSGVEIDTRLLTVPRLNVSLPLHRFNPYRRPGAIQASRDPILLDSNLEMVGPSHSVTVTPPPLPLRRGLYSLLMLLLRSREHFTCFIFNDRDGFLMDADTLKVDLIEWASGEPGVLEVCKIIQTQKFIKDEIRDCLAMCCESLYGIWDALGEMSEQDFIAFIADLLTGEKFLNGPIEVEGVMRNIPFGHVGMRTSVRHLLYSGLRYEQYISPSLNLEPLLTFVGLAIAWVLSQHKSGTFVKIGFVSSSPDRVELHKRLRKIFQKLTPAELRALTIHIFTQRGVPPNI
ncbi:hypothetical protein BDR06DRAFT_973722, partial [Suillus hirtellus]